MKFSKIKGDTPRSIIRLPRLGKLRLGVKKVSAKSGKEYPTETDFFVCPPEVQAVFGAEPKTLRVMIPVEDEEMFLRQYYAVYGGNQRIKCQGDGEQAERRDDNGQVEQLPCPSPEKCAFGQKFKCSARTDIMLVLPDVNCGGTYQISTGSVNSDIDIRSGLEMARHLFGRVSWVPMQIAREEKKIPDPATGKMQSHWPVKLYPVATIAETNAIRADTKRILDRQQNFALEEPVIEGPMADTPTVVVEGDIPDAATAMLPAATAVIEGQKVAPSAPAAPDIGKVVVSEEVVLKKISEIVSMDGIGAFQKWSEENKAEISKLPQESKDKARVAFVRKREDVEVTEQGKIILGYETTLVSCATVGALDKVMVLVGKTVKDGPAKVKLQMLRDQRAVDLKSKKIV
ncbi:MAG: hypothetical protein HY954_07540 [Deltaproteobacteria bacterium]|nr:hypothetical protein [Deltaproteobacteria bacterium]